MSKGINKVILIGSVGKDPEIRSTADGTQIANLSVATSEQWKDKQGNKQESTEWHRVSAFGKLAEIIWQYVTKGSKVYIEGKLKTRKWQDKDGKDNYTTEIVASELQMLGGGDSAQKQKGSGDHGKYQTVNTVPADDFDDQDIPFN